MQLTIVFYITYKFQLGLRVTLRIVIVVLTNLSLVFVSTIYRFLKKSSHEFILSYIFQGMD